MVTIRKLVSFLLSFLLILEQSSFAQVAASIDLSSHFANFGKSIIQSDKFRPLHLRYISYDNQSNDFKLLLDKGDTSNQLMSSGANELNKATQELLNYFFIGISLPNDKFWVNLRPDSPDNIIDDDLAMTDIGRIFLEADVQLKKDTANFTSPQTKEGKEYWDKLYKKAEELFGTENITIPTLTRPWIVPNEIIIRESPEGAYIYKATLKVMLEEDYLKSSQLSAVSYQQYAFNDPRLKELNEYSTQLIRETIIPKLTYEVNTSKRYAPLRQVYYSLILAQWFKQKFKGRQTIYSQLIDSNTLIPTHHSSLITSHSYSKQTYFQQYQKSFKDGEYNLQEPVYTPYGQSIRRYMSGGIGAFQFQPEKISSSSVIQDKWTKLQRWFSPYLIAVAVLFPKGITSAAELKLEWTESGVPQHRIYFKKGEHIGKALQVVIGKIIKDDNFWLPNEEIKRIAARFKSENNISKEDYAKKRLSVEAGSLLERLLINRYFATSKILTVEKVTVSGKTFKIYYTKQKEGMPSQGYEGVTIGNNIMILNVDKIIDSAVSKNSLLDRPALKKTLDRMRNVRKHELAHGITLEHIKNGHASREFYEIIDNFPQEVKYRIAEEIAAYLGGTASDDTQDMLEETFNNAAGDISNENGYIYGMAGRVIIIELAQKLGYAQWLFQERLKEEGVNIDEMKAEVIYQEIIEKYEKGVYLDLVLMGRFLNSVSLDQIQEAANRIYFSFFPKATLIRADNFIPSIIERYINKKIANGSSPMQQSSSISAVESISNPVSTLTLDNKGDIADLAGAPLTPSAKDELGGINFNALPIQIQTMPSVSSALTTGTVPKKAGTVPVNLDAEWAQIQAMVNAHIRPSPQRLVEYALAASSSLAYENERDKLIGLCADVLRNDEENEKLPATEPILKSLLTALESDQPAGLLYQVSGGNFSSNSL